MRFNADEILQIAIDIERNGQAYYRSAAQATKDEPTRELFLKLAEWEVVHEETFARMQKNFQEQQAALAQLDPNNESAKYLQAIADGKIFNREATVGAPATDDPAELLANALQREKDAVIFYLAMQDAVPSHLGSDEVRHIIQEEMSHVRFISEEIQRLKS